MRFREFSENKSLPPAEPGADQPILNPPAQVGSNTQIGQSRTVDQKQNNLNGKSAAPVYADQKQINQLIADLRTIYPVSGNVQLKNEPAGGSKLIRHLRITDVSGVEVKKSLESIGAVAQTTPLTKEQTSTSTSKLRMGFVKDGITFTVVLGSSRKNGDQTGIVAEKKRFSPTKLGLGGRKFTRDELISAASDAVRNSFKNSLPIQQMLLGLIEIAKTGGTDTLSPESQSVLQDNYKNVSQDFGEVLAPILMLKNKDQCKFPESGNEPLTDVTVGDMNYSIKSLSGSGTSFKSISKLMDRYEDSIKDNQDLQKLYAPLAEFNPKKGGNNLDKIIRACNIAKTPEFVEIARILGVEEIKSWTELTTLLEKKISDMDYPTFLNTFKSASMAGKWPTRGGKGIQMLGFPADALVALGLKDRTPGKEDRAAGAPSYAANKINAAGNILVYVMGKGLEFYVQRSEKVSNQYKQMMTDIVKTSDASLGHITVNPNGSMSVEIQPFSTLKFSFQYHAPSHIAGNNLPGFAIVR